MHIQPSQSGAAAVPVAAVGYSWQSLDRFGSYFFATFIVGGGICTPLGLAIYSLFFRE